MWLQAKVNTSQASFICWLTSIQATPPQVISYNDISDSIKHKLDVVGVGGAGHMGVDLFVGRLVLAFVLTLNVGYSLQVCVWT